jgi:hypothetical protein
VEQGVVDAFMDEQAPERRAALTGGAHGAKAMARSAMSDRPSDEDAGIVAAEFHTARAKRFARRGPTSRPMRVEPVAETSGTFGWSTDFADGAVADQNRRQPFGRVAETLAARLKIASQASAVSGVFPTASTPRRRRRPTPVRRSTTTPQPGS